MTDIAYTVVRLLQEFPNIEAKDDRPWKPLVRATLFSTNGVWIGLKA